MTPANANCTWYLRGEAIKEPLHYPQCGLDNIYLRSGYDIIQTPDGEGVSVKNLDGLREAIAIMLATRNKFLSGREVRFLRKEMDLTQSELGRLFGTDAQTVARWEKEQTIINGPAEKLLRVLYLEHAKGNVQIQDLLQFLDERDAQINEPHVFEETQEGWRASA